MNSTAKATGNRPPHADEPQMTEDIDLRLRRQVFLCSQVHNELTFARSEAQYCSSFLQTLRNEHERMKNCYLFAKGSPFGGWEAKLKQLSASALSPQVKETSQIPKVNTIKLTANPQCSQKRHLFYILAKEAASNEASNIALLEQKLQHLYQQVSVLVNEEYLNDKILTKIKREAHRASRLKTLQLLGHQISKHKNWVEQRQQNLKSEVALQEAKEKIMHNLQLMKLVMNKKVINNDYIYEQFEQNSQNHHKLIDKVASLSAELEAQHSSALRMFRAKLLESNQQRQGGQSSKQASQQLATFDMRDVSAYLSQLSETLEEIDSYEQEQSISQRCQQLQRRLDLCWSVLKR